MIALLSPWVERKYIAPPTSLLYLKYYLQDHGHKVDIIDCSNFGRDGDDVIDILKRHDYEVIGITAYTRERFAAYDLINRIRREIPKSLIVVGGKHFGFLAEETLKNLPVDIVVRGEGEVPLLNICDNIPWSAIPGISWAHPWNGEIFHNPPAHPFENIDQFRCFDKADNYPLAGISKFDSKPYFSIMATRGCPNRCVFCSQNASKVRYRSIDSIMREIYEKITITGIRNVVFADSSLTINGKFVRDLCAKLAEWDVRWTCYSRVNIDTSLLKTMKDAGLVSVEVGLESGSPKVLKAIKKNIQVDQVREFCKAAQSLGIKTYLFCMVSLPEETVKDVDMTISLVKELTPYIYYIGLQVTRIVPDAALYGIAKDKGLLPETFSWFEPYESPYADILKDKYYSTLPVYVEHLSIEQITQKLTEFKHIIDSRLSNFAVLWKAVKYNLSQEGRKLLTPKNLAIKGYKLTRSLFTSIKNAGKYWRV